jgi:site-specific DNA-methyltransferase (adenine-specific)
VSRKHRAMSIMNYESKKISIKNAAEQLNVSVVSIHNWIKEGILKTVDNHVTQESLDEFKREFLNNNKLSARANKQYKESHNHNSLTITIKKDLKSSMSGDDVSSKYESLLSDSYKNKEGIYYTPQYIVEDMLKDIVDVENKTFLDPCCGSGNFIIEAIKKGISPENVYGFDVDENAVLIARKRIKDLCGYDSKNIICADFLSQKTKAKSQRFDYIFTNPPWGKKINKADKLRYSSLYNSGNSNDTSALFYFACLKVLKENGKIGMLLPDSFFNISSFENARKSLLSLQINRFVDYGKAFKGLMTKAVAFVACKVNRQQTTVNSQIECEIYSVKKHLRSQESFADIPKCIFNFHIEESESDIIRHVFSMPHIRLKDNAKWGLGVITGNNEKICKKEKTKGCVPIYRGKDIMKNTLSEPSLYIDENLEGCRQVADMELYKSPEKVIYRFISNRIVCFYDTEQRYILNSANLFVLNEDFPISYSQLVDLLNSDFMNWLFRSIFNTHKILRSDLEMLPIFHEYFKENEVFSEESFKVYMTQTIA